MLANLSASLKSLFSTALYTGLRKGEILGLCKAAVDLENRLLTVSHSYRRDTTKGGHADVIPIASELVPYLEDAISRSPSALVFPAPDGLDDVGPSAPRAGAAPSAAQGRDRPELAP